MGLREGGGGSLPAGVGGRIQPGMNRIYRVEKENYHQVSGLFIRLNQGKENRPGNSPGRFKFPILPRTALLLRVGREPALLSGSPPN